MRLPGETSSTFGPLSHLIIRYTMCSRGTVLGFHVSAKRLERQVVVCSLLQLAATHVKAVCVSAQCVPFFFFNYFSRERCTSPWASWVHLRLQTVNAEQQQETRTCSDPPALLKYVKYAAGVRNSLTLTSRVCLWARIIVQHFDNSSRVQPRKSLL